MKTIRIMIASAMALLMLVSCSEKTHGPGVGNVPEPVLETFSEMYPDATDVEWSTKDIYWVAAFGGTATKAAPDRNSAWFDQSGKWYMTEFSYVLDRLPQAVSEAFLASEYADWRVEDVDFIRRNGVETIYVIEVEGERDGVRMEVDLYYSEDGVLVKEVVDAEDDYDYSDFIPSDPGTGIQAYLSENYPDARIVDIENEDWGVEVDIVDSRVFRELYFDRSEKWIQTKTEMRYHELPDYVLAVLDRDYAGYRVDDVDYYETANDGNFYLIELESRNGDMKIKVDTDGNVSDGGQGNRPGYGDGGSAGGTHSELVSFVEEKYPGARIEGFDTDDGYVEVEIWHDGREKSVYFNGRSEWVWTEWDVRYSELPDAVKSVLENDYEGYYAEDLTYIETPQSVFYLVEMESRNDREITLRITPDGTVQ